MFDWQTEEDHWDDDPIATEPTAVGRSRWSWVTAVVIVMVVGVAGFILYREVTQRINTATSDVQNDILASHNLLLFANQEADNELLFTVLSGRDARWATAQESMLKADLLLNRRPFGFTYQPNTKPLSLGDVQQINPNEIDIELASDFESATMVYEQPYTIQLGNGVTETVTLQQTAIYRRGTQRWLYAPPTVDFWGETKTYEGRYLTIDYPQRDAEPVNRLGPALDRKLDELCQRVPDINCPDGWKARLNLVATPDILLSMADPEYVLANGRYLEMPTPTLVGLPVDEDGYQALFRGYANHLLTGAMADLMGYDCCRSVALFQAMVDWQLVDLALRPSPITDNDFSRLLLETNPFETVIEVSKFSDPTLLSSPDGWTIYALVQFLNDHRPDLSLADMQRQLVIANNAFDWLDIMLVTDPLNQQDPISVILADSLLSYAIERSANTTPPPIPLPDQVVHAICNVPNETEAASTTVYRLFPATNEVQQLAMESNAFAFMIPLPADNMAVMPLINFEEESSWQSWHTYLWRTGQSDPALIADDGQTFSFGQTDPTQQHVVGYTFNETGEETTTSLLDLNDCDESNCTRTILDGIPIWSPDGSQTIMVDYDRFFQNTLIVNGRSFLFDVNGQIMETNIFIGDELGNFADNPAISYGYAPFWIDNQTIGYLRRPLGNNQTHHLVVHSLATDDQQAITVERFITALPESAPQNTRLQLRYAIPHPLDPETIFVATFDEVNGIIYVFSWNWQTDRVDYQLQTNTNGVGEHSLGVSPDGEWLVATAVAYSSTYDGNATNIYLHHVATQETQTFTTIYPGFIAAALYDWSLDGQWFVMPLNNDAFLLLAPEYDYIQFIPYEFGTCTSVAWFNP